MFKEHYMVYPSNFKYFSKPLNKIFICVAKSMQRITKSDIYYKL